MHLNVSIVIAIILSTIYIKHSAIDEVHYIH